MAGLLFDLDGTLAQTEHLHHAAFNAILAPSGRSLDDEAFLRHVSGQANHAIMAFFFPDASHRGAAASRRTEGGVVPIACGFRRRRCDAGGGCHARMGAATACRHRARDQRATGEC